MKKIIISFLLLFLVSCGSSNLTTRKDGPSENALYDESFLKISTKKLDQIAKDRDSSPISKAIISCHKRDFKNGENDLLELFSSQKDNPYYWNALGICHFLYGQYSKAEFNFSRASLLAKNKGRQHAMAQNNLAVIYHIYGHYLRVREILENISKEYPDLTTPKYNLAHLYLQFNLPQRAVELFDLISSKNTNDIDVLEGRALALILLGQPKQALNYFEKIPKSDRKREDIAATYAWALSIDGRPEEALMALNAGRKTDIEAVREFSDHLLVKIKKAVEEKTKAEEQAKKAAAEKKGK